MLKDVSTHTVQITAKCKESLEADAHTIQKNHNGPIASAIKTK